MRRRLVGHLIMILTAVTWSPVYKQTISADRNTYLRADAVGVGSHQTPPVAEEHRQAVSAS